MTTIPPLNGNSCNVWWHLYATIVENVPSSLFTGTFNFKIECGFYIASIYESDKQRIRPASKKNRLIVF